MNKQSIRAQFKAQRKALSAHDRSRLDDLLLIRFQQLDFSGIINVLSYWPLGRMAEINTHLFTDFLDFALPEFQLAYPIMDPQTHQLTAHAVHAETRFALNDFGIAEPLDTEILAPADIDLVITPLLAFDTRGYRVGYGKGYYDRFLADCRPDVVALGLSYFEPVERIEDVNDFDVPLSIAITPQQVYEF
jgi:5-formyltetrahydrofolate cyclo-ligase